MKQLAVVCMSFLFGGLLSAQGLREQLKYDSKPGLATIQPAKRVADGKFWAVGAGLMLSTAFDIETTHRGLSNCTGCKEANPIAGLLISRNRPTAYMVGTAINAGVMYLMYKMKKKGNHKTWWIGPTALTGVHAVAGSSNMRFVRQ
jgi:hypothetical protein